ncbi:MAG: metallophosphoesterase [bacterium]
MKLAIVSDLHLGDPQCALVVPSADGYALGPLYDRFAEAVGTDLDYLVLAGDVLEIMLSSYVEAYKAARVFFRRVREDGLAKQIVFIAGNHDFEIWHTVEHEVNVINRMRRGLDPRPFRWSVPGVIDDRSDAQHRGLSLPDVHPRADVAGEYGDLFLDGLTRDGASDDSHRLPFAFAYPNLYIVTASGETVLVTHGHYLESYWSLLSNLAMRIVREDLGLDPRSRQRATLSMRELVAINFPLTQLTSSGLGQSGPLSQVVNHLQRDVERQEFRRVESLLTQLLPAFTTGSPWYLDALAKAASSALSTRVIRSLRDYQAGSYADDLGDHAGTRARFLQFLDASLDELDRLLEDHQIHVPFPRHLVFGHTHQPHGWNESRAWREPRSGIELHNSGGWVRLRATDGSWRFPGAQVFRYSTGRGFDSRAVVADAVDTQAAA